MTKSKEAAKAGPAVDAKTKISFLKSSSPKSGWLSLDLSLPETTSEELLKKAEHDAKALHKQLDEYLQSVLTTPNLVILVGSGASCGKAGGPSMKDLWDAVSQLEKFEEIVSITKYPKEDEWIENLLSRCQSAEFFLDASNAKKVKDFLSAAEALIISKCSDFLEKADLNGHRIFLKRMARRRLRAPRLKLFTLNYDLCFETAAADLGITLIDGFSFAVPRLFDPRFFTYDLVRRSRARDESHDFVEGVVQIMKLHGSVNWDNTPRGIIQGTNPKKPCLVYPASAKYEQSYSQPYLELMAQFQWALREPNTALVTVGFGFNDHHVTAPILAAVESNPSFKLLAVDRCAEEKSAKGDTVYHKLQQKINSGEADLALLNADFDQFAELIPQLRALSPAEQIERSIKQMTNK